MKTERKRAAKIMQITILFLLSQIIFCGCGYTKPVEKTLCVCVTADSTAYGGQSVRSDVISAVGYYLENVLIGAGSYDSAAQRTRERIGTIRSLSSAVVRRRGGGYGVEVSLRENSGGSELIIKLGTGNGGSEMAAVYPKAVINEDDVVYESVLVDIVNKFL